MKIIKVKLHNIGPYKNENNLFDLDVKKGKNIILIGGKNGAGKTTLLNSIKIGLFGTYAFGLKNGGSQYYTFLNQLFNYVEARKKISYYEIEIEFELIENYIVNRYKFNRSWKKINDNVSESFRVQKNKRFLDSEDIENIQAKLKEIMPPSVINTMLFDGEKIAQIIEDNKISEYLKEIIDVNFNINIFDKTEEDINYYINKEKNRKVFSIDEINLIEYQNKYNEAQKNLKNLHDIYQKYLKTFDENKFKLRILLKKFENYGGLTEKDKTSMRISLELLESTRRDSINKIKDFLEDDIVFYLNKDKIYKIKESINYEKPLIFLNYMEELKNYLGVKLTSEVKQKLTEHVNNTNLSIKYNASDRLVKQLDSIYERLEITTSKEIKMILTNTRDDFNNSKIYKKIIGNNESENSADLQKLLKEIKILEINIEELKFKIKNIEKDIAKAESDTKSTLLELETIEKKIDSERKEENSFNIARKILKASKEYKELQILQYLSKIAELSVKKFSDINNKENYISKIKFDKNTYNIILYDNNGIEKDINILSAGEKQLLLSAIIWSIFKLSDRNTLFTFDTPLARLDKENRILFVEKILGTISDQVLILSTNEEIVGNLLKIINKRINKKYLLLNDEKEGKTIIEEGYFS